MKDNVANRNTTQPAARSVNGSTARWLMIAVVAMIASLSAFAQDSAIEEKIAAVKQAMAMNAQRLHQYQWIETTQVTLKGDPKPPTQKLCHYGPDGQVQKTPIGTPPEEVSGGRLKQRIAKKKKAELKDYMGDVKDLLALYLPPDPQKMEQAKQAGNLSLNPISGAMNFIFANYAQPGDRMTLTFATVAKKVVYVDIATYMGEEKDAVTLQVQMASLPDGTNFAEKTTLNATAKNLQVTTTNSNYQKVVAP